MLKVLKNFNLPEQFLKKLCLSLVCGVLASIVFVTIVLAATLVATSGVALSVFSAGTGFLTSMIVYLQIHDECV